MIKYRKNEGGMAVIEILYKSKNAVVVYKSAGIPSQSDLTNDKDAMTLTSERLSTMGENPALWLIHRLDRVVGGLIVFARNKKYAAILSELVKERLITKEYYAVVDGEAEGGVLENLIFKDSKTSKAFITDRERAGVKSARLSYRALATAKTEKGTKTLVYVTLETGRFHQIRAQFSHIGCPITGDKKYGSKDNRAHNVALAASHLDIELPAERIDVKRLPDVDVYPWSLFTNEDYEL